MSVSIIIPAYNEEQRLPMTLATTAEYFANLGDPFDILVVDDGSRDKTAAVVTEYRKKHPEYSVKCVEYGGNRGKGFAVRFGMLKATGELRLFCDADLATPVEEYGVILKAMQQQCADIGIGSRPLEQSHLVVHQPWLRERLGRSFNLAVQALAVPGIRDTQCGFKIFTAQAAKDVFSRCVIDAFAFDCEALLIADRLGYKIAEVPIRWSHKDGSKVNMVRDGSRMLKDLMAIRWLHRDLPPRRIPPK